MTQESLPSDALPDDDPSSLLLPEPPPLMVHESETDRCVQDILQRRIGHGIDRDYTRQELRR